MLNVIRYLLYVICYVLNLSDWCLPVFISFFLFMFITHPLTLPY